VDAKLDEWAQMNHVFQAFGPALPQSAEALGRIGEEVRRRTNVPLAPPIGDEASFCIEKK
jgi:hypothetical protein